MRRRHFLLILCVAGRALAILSVENKPVEKLPLDANLGIEKFPLWSGPALGALGPTASDLPTVNVFLPQGGQGHGSAVVVAPGGACLGFAANLESRQVADWFASRGVTAFVLKYRLGANYLFPTPLIDAQRAVRWVRANSAKYKILPDRIGMIGFSAGSHLAAMIAISGDDGNQQAEDEMDRASSRLNFVVLGYMYCGICILYYLYPPNEHEAIILTAHCAHSTAVAASS